MGIVGASFGVAVAAVVAVSLFEGRRHPSFDLALMMVMFWIAANLVGPWIDPVMDAGGFYAAMWVAFGQPRMKWAWVVCVAFLAQLTVHPFFIGNEDSALRILLLNILFAVELLAIATPGGLRAIRLLLDRVSRAGGARNNQVSPVARRPHPPA